MLLSTAICVLAVQGGEHEAENGLDRDVVVDKRIPDFDYFKNAFDKRYPNLAEELRRRGVYMANAVQVFMSYIQYRKGESDSFLATNERSDWTPDELRRSFVDLDILIPQMMGDLDGLWYKPDDGEREEPPNANLAPEADNQEALNIENVFRAPKGDEEQESPEVEAKLVDSIDSNNPEYEPFEGISFGAEEEEGRVMPSIGEMTDELVEKREEANFFEKALHLFLDFVIPGRRPQVNIVKVDHRSRSCFTKPRNQGMCGSCYAFAAIALFEYLYCRDTGKLVEFSEQYVVDCGARTSLKGCDGGNIARTVEFTAKHGLELRRNYPYEGRSRTCPYSKSVSSKSMGYVRPAKAPLPWFVLPIFFEKALAEQPVVIAMSTNLKFSFYGGGIDRMTTCNTKESHAVLLVGYGQADGVPYWIIRNSYGYLWGERGYYRLHKRQNCIHMTGITYGGKFASENSRTINPDYKHGPVKSRHVQSV